MKLVNKGEILSDSVDDIYDIIFREYTHKGFCDVDFEGVKTITTKFAGKLFADYAREKKNENMLI